MTLLLLTAAAVLGYAAGRHRPGRRAVDWAQDTVTREPGLSPVLCIAVPVIVLAVTAVWILHPRRTAENRRSWREEHPPAPTPQRDPEWARRRTAETDTPDD